MTYMEYLQKELEKKLAADAKCNWSIPADNGETGESVQRYYRKNGYC